MKNKHILLSGLLALGIGLSSCNSFLEREPLDQVTPEQYFKTDKHLAAYAIAQYNFPTKGGWGLGSQILGDTGTDNMASSDANYNRWVPERWLTSQNGGIDFGSIRQANYFFDKVLPKYENGEITGSEDLIKQYIGEMYFIRAWEYFKNLKAYGDFPILKEVLPDDKEILIKNSVRQPRSEVARFILEDLDKAIELMSNNSAITANKTRLSKNAALLFKSRVALYEGSWLKYHAGTARVPNGPEWPGKRIHPDFEFKAGSLDSEVNFFLTEAVNASKELLSIPLQSQGAGLINPEEDSLDPTGWNDYFEMFGARTMNQYDEVIFWREYSNSQSINHGTTLYIRRGANNGLTKGYVESFLMKDGKPIYAAGDAYKGDETLDNVKENRDPRLQLFMIADSDRFNMAANDESETDPEFGGLSTFGKQSLFPFIINLKETRMVTGYSVRKCLNMDPKYMSGGELIEETGSIVFRVAEAYLNYLEASYLLKGNLTPEAKKVWGKIRERAGMSAASIDVTIQHTNLDKEAAGDWAVYSAGEKVDPTLYNIRRERRSEFIAEGMRWDDLYRWASLNQVREYIIEGFNLWDSNYERYVKEDKKEDGTVKKTSLLIQPGEGKEPNVSAKSESKYLRPYRMKKANNEIYEGYSFRQAKYLSPIPIRHIQLASPTENVDDSNFYQNPGWPSVGNSPAEKSNDPLDN